MSDVCVCGRIFWEDRREEEKKEGADTALKTKTHTSMWGKSIIIWEYFLKIVKIRLKYYIRNCNHIYIHTRIHLQYYEHVLTYIMENTEWNII